MDPTSSPVAITRRPRKWQRVRRITLTPAGPRVGIQVTVDGGSDGGWTRWLTPRSAAELLELLASDVERLSERLWGGA